jgi:VanZ family protein
MKKIKPVYYYLATLCWWAAIWTASSIPTNKLPSINILGWDKLAHTGVYFVLALLVNKSMKLLGVSRKKAVWVYLVLLATAALDEAHQAFIPGRRVTVWDFAANGTGLALGFLLLQLKHDKSR